MSARNSSPAPAVTFDTRSRASSAAGAVAGGGLVGVVAALVAGDYGLAAIAATMALPAGLHQLVAAGGLRGVALALWRGR